MFLTLLFEPMDADDIDTFSWIVKRRKDAESVFEAVCAA